MNDSIIVSGKVIDCSGPADCRNWKSSFMRAEIKLTPPTPEQLAALKEGDEVLVKLKVSLSSKLNRFLDNIVAILKREKME